MRVLALLVLCAAACAGTEPLVPPPDGATELRIAGKAGAIQAFLWRPAGSGPFPALVYNHGSERWPVAGTRGTIGPYFAAHGFVVLFPHRRGSGNSEGASWRERAQGDDVMAALAEENDDVVTAVEWLRGQPWVSSDQISVAGCSFGGIQTLLTAERPVPGLHAAVDFAGGAMSWKDEALRGRLVATAAAARVPVFFVQAENDFDTAPSRALSEVLRDLGKPYRMKIYPPYGTTNREGHGGFCLFGSEIWGPDVLDFLRAP